MTPMKAIRAKCLDCCCGSSNEVRLCTAKNARSMFTDSAKIQTERESETITPHFLLKTPTQRRI